MNERQESIIIADDEGAVLAFMNQVVSSWGYRTIGVGDRACLLAALAREQPVLLILDLHFGESNGLTVLQEVVRTYPTLRIVLLTGRGTIDDAVAAIKHGAYDFLTKPPELPRLKMIVRHAAEQHALQRRIKTLEDSVEIAAQSRRMFGESKAMQQVGVLIDAVAPTDAAVLILGESGTGKELVARAIHDKSRRPRDSFFAVNMAALPSSLIESTLFGHEKGAFTGAEKARAGYFERADKGTLLLDEIGEMDLALQAKLLRFLQERSFERIGGSETISVDCRIVAATNRNLLEMVRDGKFREDLYYRLNVVPIELPPLRARGDDIVLLANRFVAKSSARYGKTLRGFTPAALQRLTTYRWPGNVRELENVIERAVILSTGKEIGADALPADAAPATPTQPASAGDSQPLCTFDQIERQAIVDALDKASGKIAVAAKNLGLGQATIYRKLKRYEIPLRRN